MTKQKTDNHLKNLLLDTLAEFYQEFIKKEMASKDDLKNFATKDDLKNFATKKDLKNFATKDDLKNFATKKDLEKFATKAELKQDLDELETRLMREIQENNRLITNIEVSILDKLKNHELVYYLPGLTVRSNFYLPFFVRS